MQARRTIITRTRTSDEIVGEAYNADSAEEQGEVLRTGVYLGPTRSVASMLASLGPRHARRRLQAALNPQELAVDRGGHVAH